MNIINSTRRNRLITEVQGGPGLQNCLAFLNSPSPSHPVPKKVCFCDARSPWLRRFLMLYRRWTIYKIIMIKTWPEWPLEALKSDHPIRLTNGTNGFICVSLPQKY